MPPPELMRRGGESPSRPSRVKNIGDGATHIWMKRKKITFCSSKCVGGFSFSARKMNDKDKEQIAKESVIEVKKSFRDSVKSSTDDC